MVTDAMKYTEDNLHQNCQIQDYRNEDRLSVCRILFTTAKT